MAVLIRYLPTFSLRQTIVSFDMHALAYFVHHAVHPTKQFNQLDDTSHTFSSSRSSQVSNMFNVR